MFVVVKRSVSTRKRSCESQLTPSRQIAAASAGCRSRCAPSLQRRDRLERALVANLPERHHRIVLERAIELGDRGERGHGVGGLVIAERLDHRAAEEVLAAIGLAHEHLLHRGIRRRARPARGSATAGRTRTALSRAWRSASARAAAPGSPRARRTRRRAADRWRSSIAARIDVARALIVEAGEQHQRAEAHVAVGVLARGPDQRRHRLLGRRAPHGS